MHRDNIQPEPNLMDPEDREAFLYDAELFAKAHTSLQLEMHGLKKLEEEEDLS